jgi:hypothetical protein
MSDRIMISRAHRDALYDELLTDLHRFRELGRLVFGNGADEPDPEDCERIGRRLTDALRLIQDGGIGWGYPEGDDPVYLTLPHDELRRIMLDQRRRFAVAHQARQRDKESTQAEWDQLERAREVCVDILGQLGEPVSS